MIRVKICGNTRLEDALQAVEAGADLLGFIFYPRSPRKVSIGDARAISRAARRVSRSSSPGPLPTMYTVPTACDEGT